MRRALAGILLLPLLIVIFGIVTNGGAIIGFLLGPIDDPGYFCLSPDPSPLPNLGSQLVLQECAAGKTFTVAKGQTIAVDLVAYAGGVDSWTTWGDVTASDEQVLSTVSVRRTNQTRTSFRVDEVAVYRGVKTGEATLSAVEHNCGGRNASCDQGHRWRVTVSVR